MSTAVAEVVPQTRPGLIQRFAASYGVEPNKMVSQLKQTCFKLQAKDGRPQEVTNEELMALLIVAEQYGLNPWLREIYAFPDRKRGGIVPIIGVDGWTRIVLKRPDYNGANVLFSNKEDPKSPLEWIECTMFRRDIEHSFPVREYLIENRRDTDLWKTMPNRMLRHRAWMQAARLTFGFTGLYDEDDARRIIEGTVVVDTSPVSDINAEITGKPQNGVGATETVVETSGDQPATDASSEPTGEAEAMDFAEVAAKITAAWKAKSPDKAAEAIDLIRYVKDEAQQTELRSLAAQMQRDLEK